MLVSWYNNNNKKKKKSNNEKIDFLSYELTLTIKKVITW
jgi:hypothetical protein